MNKELRRVITSTIPKAEEGISWGFSAFKSHAGCGFAFGLDQKDRDMLEKKRL